MHQPRNTRMTRKKQTEQEKTEDKEVKKSQPYLFSLFPSVLSLFFSSFSCVSCVSWFLLLLAVAIFIADAFEEAAFFLAQGLQALLLDLFQELVHAPLFGLA